MCLPLQMKLGSGAWGAPKCSKPQPVLSKEGGNCLTRDPRLLPCFLAGGSAQRDMGRGSPVVKISRNSCPFPGECDTSGPGLGRGRGGVYRLGLFEPQDSPTREIRQWSLYRWGHGLQRGETLVKPCGQGRTVDSSPGEGLCTPLLLAAPLPYGGLTQVSFAARDPGLLHRWGQAG